MSQVPVFDATNYVYKPPQAIVAADYNVRPAIVPATQHVADQLSDGTWVVNGSKLLPYVEQAAAENALLIFDFEMGDVALNAQRCAQTIRLARSMNPNIKLGAYGFSPGGGPALTQAEQYSWVLSEWWKNQAGCSEVIDLVDVVCPSLYSTNNAQTDQQVAALAITFAACRWPDKLIMPFLSPSVGGNGTVEVTHDVLWNQFVLAQDACDGVIWWNANQTWGVDADAWSTVKAFALPGTTWPTPAQRAFLP